MKGHSGEEGNEGADFLAQRGTWLPELPERNWRFEGDEDDYEVLEGLRCGNDGAGNGRKVSISLRRVSY